MNRPTRQQVEEVVGTWMESTSNGDDIAKEIGNLFGIDIDADLSPRVIPVGDDGLLTCECGNQDFKENGSHPCDWDFESQDAATKTLTLDGSFEWYEGDFVSYECTSCGKNYDALPEGWNTDYT